MFGLRNWKAEYGALRQTLQEMANDLADAQIGKYDLQKRLDAIIALETPNPAHGLKKAIRIARGEPAPVKAKPLKVEAGPVPKANGCLLSRLRNVIAGKIYLIDAFGWCSASQGGPYWARANAIQRDTGKLPDEARSIIETWIAELEAKAAGGAS